ncbi:MAG TPA: tetratricopeptide repeat protein [Cerasibacillus sp.]|uniref:tetratricopeptide repeat protein n=1 Tax=Cerasibacillus sp. TaxID=2498711 RepID=UPI002F42C9D2
MDTIKEASQLMEMNLANEAIILIQEALDKATDHEKKTYAAFFMEWGFLDEARSILEPLNDMSHDSHVILMLAEIYTEQQEDAMAIELLLLIDSEDDAYLPALVQLADLYEQEGLFEVAEQKLLEAKRIAPQEEVIDFALGELYYSVGEYNRAILYYEKMTTDMLDVSISERLAHCFTAIGKYEVAFNYFKSIKEPNFFTLFSYGLTAFQLERDDVTIHVLEKLLKQDPYYHSAYPLLAEAYERQGLINEAYNTVKQGLEYDEFNKELYYYLGILSQKLNRIAESEAMFQEAIALDPDYKEAILSLIALWKDVGRTESIIGLIEDVKKTGSVDALYEWELGRAYLEIDERKQALNAYKQAYTNLQDDPDFLKEYGTLLNEEGMQQEALNTFRAYLNIISDDYDVAAFVERIEERD